VKSEEKKEKAKKKTKRSGFRFICTYCFVRYRTDIHVLYVHIALYNMEQVFMFRMYILRKCMYVCVYIYIYIYIYVCFVQYRTDIHVSYVHIAQKKTKRPGFRYMAKKP